MTDLPDLLSAWYHRVFNKKKSKTEDGSYKSWSIEKFPYIEHIGEAISRDLALNLSDPVFKFYENVWKPRKRKEGNKRFFNFCKTMLIRDDNQMTVIELYTAESINRYISGMFYSLLISFLLILITIPLQVKHEISIILFCLLLFYFLALVNIISRFRFIRIKEAQTMFDACYKNKDLFIDENSKESNKDLSIDNEKI